MTDEGQSGLLFESWLKGTDPTPPDASRSVAQVMDRVPKVRQRGRWWPLPAFDRPVSKFPSRELVPAPIPATNGRQPARGFTMFSALKFIAAGVIVALFGGFLLGGVFTTQQGEEMAPAAVTESPLPMTTEELLSGMVTEEVEPGVFRVVNDGVRDVPSSPRRSERFEVVAGHDGGIYVLLDSSFYRLGDDQVYKWPKPGTTLEVAPNGTIWTATTEGRKAALHSFDGETWTAYDGRPGDLVISPSGTVWVVRIGPGSGSSVVYTSDDGANWQTLETPASLMVGEVHDALTVANDSDLGFGQTGPLSSSFWHYSDGTWHRSDYFTRTRPRSNSNGTYWFVGSDDGSGDGEPGLVRYDGSEWHEWSLEEVSLYPNVWGPDLLAVAPDGSLWTLMARSSAEAETGTWCEGVSRFDGESLQRYLGESCVDGMDIAADGSVWATTKQGLYVITPEAVAAKG